jgi:hypothetical protein
MPIRLAVRITLIAISPRFAIKTRLILRQWLFWWKEEHCANE